MTMTVKLDPKMERELRRRSAALGVPASAMIREALAQWLESNRAPEPSAFELGEDLFGRHEGSGNLATDRKEIFAEVVAERHVARQR